MLTISKSNLRGEVTPPPSKSATHRAYIIASMLGNGSTIKNPLLSEDTDATLTILKQMGLKYTFDQNEVIVEESIGNGAGKADCRNSGTTLRLLTALNSGYRETTILTGDDSLVKRPIMDLVGSLQQLGAEIETVNGFPPVTIKKPIDPEMNSCTLNPSKSSQFLSGLLLLGANIQNGLEIVLTGDLPSRPYVDMTIQMLEEAGATIIEKKGTFLINRALKDRRIDFTIPADFSSAAFFIVAGALPGNSITISGINRKYPQADSAIVEIVKRFGASVEEHFGSLTISHEELIPQEINLADSPDLFPILGVLAAFTEGKTRIFGAEHLKYKETNRIKTTGQLVRQLGAEFIERSDGAIIQGKRELKGGKVVDSFGDHRIAMAAAIAATQAKKGLGIRNWVAAGVSYRDFFKDLKILGGNIKEEIA